MTSRRAVVIGGGVSGLATACLLARDGHQVTLLERSEHFGGRAGVWRHQGFTFDTGPSWYLMPEVFEHFYRLMGTSTREQFDLVSLHPAYRVFPEPDGIAHSSSFDVRSGPESAAALFESIEPGAGRRLRRYLASASRAYHAAVDSFLYNPFASWRGLLSRRVLTAAPAVLPLLTRSLWAFIARRFADNRLRQVLGYPAVFLGTSPFEAPALYHLMSHLDLVDGVRYPSGGFTRVVESLVDLARAHGVDMRTNTDVVSIETQAGEARAVEYVLDGRTFRIPASTVVSAIDEHHTEQILLDAAARSYPASRWRRQVTGPSAVLLMLGVEGEIPQLPHHSLFFARDWHQNFDAIFGSRQRVPDPASLYVCKPSATDDVAPPGHESLFVLVPLPADTSIGHGGRDMAADERVAEIADRAIAQISTWANIPDLAERIVLRKTVGPADFEQQYNSFRGSALGPAHTLRQSAFLRGVTASRRVSGLYYAGATTVPGVGLPMCLISAELVLKNVRGDTSPGPLEVS
ncbi:phytoene desaturase family protein [Paramicrobacterium agarici]|uniref:Phytoene desaturase n=1 Tax=Paramicrobacterium agarici TaxID=630514 RepID=A0A2A9DV29_9MICO|nr:phytoene desaturase family protein [Microbacterium agarici]PFG30637.1 phytoene desaturase [Microbacterium agarici]